MSGIATFVGIGSLVVVGWYSSDTVSRALGESQAIDVIDKHINELRFANEDIRLTAMDVIIDRAAKDLTPERKAALAGRTKELKDGLADVKAFVADAKLSVDMNAYAADVDTMAKAAGEQLPQLVTSGAADAEFDKIDDVIDSTGDRIKDVLDAVAKATGEAQQKDVDVAMAQAQQSAMVARQSLVAAESGLSAVQNAIGGMNAIRDQIQETSKRIKRLGESSQEIGEITELISDITEQTNVLALNAAIQAASAGDAGRGFSVVAEEVQRLAERSSDAARQIAALVKAIQTDTQDAVAAMERSTRGVVEGAKLSDNAGSALTEIDQVSRRLAELIEQISVAAASEAQSANVVAGNIQQIFAVTEQTGEGTRSTAQQVRDLSKIAEELRQSVSRFKIA